MNLILFGYKKCGKTYFGKRLAEKLSRPFVDTDKLIEEEYFLKKGERLSCRDICLKLGENAFRALESEALTALQNLQQSIISVGGGMVLSSHNVEKLHALGMLVYLIVDKEVLKQRILQGTLPSYLDKTDPEGSFERMYRERKKSYENIRAVHVSIFGKTEEQVLDELCAILNEKEHGQ